MAAPYVFKSKYSFVIVKRVGQAANWKNPKIASPSAGRYFWRITLVVRKIPWERDMIGITRNPAIDIRVKRRYYLRRICLLDIKNLSANPRARDV